MPNLPDIFDFWSEIKLGQKVHPRDRLVLSRVAHGFDLNCLPAAFMGPLKIAPLVLLYLSPGLSDIDHKDARSVVGKRRYFERWKGLQPLPGPEDHRGAWNWWRSRTQAFGDWEYLRTRTAVLNIGAYHSREFVDHSMLAALPSSRMSLDWAQEVLFPQAMAGERVVICLRSARFWGLQPGKRYGASLFAPKVTRAGHITLSDAMRQKIVRSIKLAIDT